MSARYVQHDGYRWRVVGEIEIDNEAGFDLTRRVPFVRKIGDTIERGITVIKMAARERDCQPDQHEPVRVLRDAHAVVRYNVKRGTVTVSAPHARRKFTTSLQGILHMCVRQDAMNKAREKAHKRRIRGRS